MRGARRVGAVRGAKASGRCTESSMRTAIHRRRHRARHAVHEERRPRRSGGAAARRAGRSTPASTSSCPCGTTGENPTLTDAERLRIVEIVVEEAKGKVPVLAGAGGYDTQRSDSHSPREMARRGASGFLSVTPYYNKPTQEGPLPALPRDSPRARRCRSSSTTCPAAPASTSRSRRSRGWRRFRTSSA